MSKEDVVVRTGDVLAMTFKMFKFFLERIESTLDSGDIEATKYLVMWIRAALDKSLELMQYTDERIDKVEAREKSHE